MNNNIFIGIDFVEPLSLKELIKLKSKKDIYYNWQYYFYNVWSKKNWLFCNKMLNDGGFIFCIVKDIYLKSKNNFEDDITFFNIQEIRSAIGMVASYRYTILWQNTDEDNIEIEKKNLKSFKERKFPTYFRPLQDTYQVLAFQVNGKRKIEDTIMNKSAFTKKEFEKYQKNIWSVSKIELVNRLIKLGSFYGDTVFNLGLTKENANVIEKSCKTNKRGYLFYEKEDWENELKKNNGEIIDLPF